MTGGTVETHVFIGSVGSDQGSVQTGLHVVNLLIVLWNTHRTHTTTSALVGLKHRGGKNAGLELTAMMLKKSSSPSVSSMEETVCRAMVSLRPFMLPLTSTKMTTSFGDVAAWMYLGRDDQSHTVRPRPSVTGSNHT